jgi:hypothetical protein
MHTQNYTAFPLQQWLRERALVLRLRTLPISFLHNKTFDFGINIYFGL